MWPFTLPKVVFFATLSNAQSNVGVHPRLVARGNAVIRPQDAADLYANPRAEFRRMARTGALRRVAVGYYVITPPANIGDPDWRPPLEDLALGIAVADYGDDAALMGLTAARYFGAVPRAHAMAWVATIVSRRRLDAGRYGRISFVTRNVHDLDLVRARTSLATGWTTSVEQTVLDVIRRPDWAGGPRAADDAVIRLLPRCDNDLIEDLAAAQRGRAALARARARLRGLA
jgi:predicted transcriptional regulator of viral defense system